MKKILIIEDNKEVRENLEEILELSSYEVVSAENGKLGVEAAHMENPDLILCDVMMPVLDGFGVLRILNKDPKLMHIPFMFLTAKAEKHDFRKGMGLGADDYITKPYDDVELLDAVEMRLKKGEMLRNISNDSTSVKHFLNEVHAKQSIDNMLKDKEVRSYSSKSPIYRYGQRPNYLYYIISGTVKCIKTSDSGKDLITGVFHDGDFFGLTSLINHEPYHEDAVATTDIKVMLIPADEFMSIIYTDRDFSATFIRLLARHVDRSEDQLIDLAFSSVRRKVSRALISYMKTVGESTFELTRDDLAAMAGTARETVIRTISDFKSEGLLDIVNGKIHILDESTLRNLPQ